MKNSGLDEVGALSRTLVVTLRFQGLAVPGWSEPDIELPVGELLLLELLARGSGTPVAAAVDEVARTAKVPTERLWALVEQLRARTLLIRTTAASQLAANGQRPERVSAAIPVEVAAALADPAAELAVATPLLLRPSAAGFDCLDHDGRILETLNAVGLAAASAFAIAKPKQAAFEAHQRDAGALALSPAAFDALVDRLAAVGLMAAWDKEGHKGREDLFIRSVVANQSRFRAAVERRLEDERRTSTARKVRVVPFDCWNEPTPLSLGMLIAYAQGYDGGRLCEHYQFSPQTKFPDQQARLLAEGPAILLFSNYLWSHVDNLRTSKEAKRTSPGSVTIHGGPDTPKYEGDIETYFRANPHVDITVRGEGELTFADVLNALVGKVGGNGPVDVSALHDVPGICFRDGDRVVRTKDRDRVADLDTLPSPYLTGVFDVYAESRPSTAIIETNRGCPYGCTFCDWGSATLSRIRKFSLERIFAELEWCARYEISRVILADANFGIFERDVEITQKVVELNKAYGYPKLFGTNYAKNSTKYLRPIVNMLIEAGILSEGTLSLQSMDQETLKVVHRSNIKLEKYDDLAKEFRHAKLPLFIDLMIGLPGSTPTSFCHDLQGAIDREVTAKIFQTELLVNSPMNEPAYRTTHRIETAAPFQSLAMDDTSAGGRPKRAFVVASSSFTRAQYAEMLDLRQMFVLCENYGVLRQVSRFVRHETGVPEVDFYARVCAESRAERERFPAIATAFALGPSLGVPPVSWKCFINEIHEYLTDRLGVRDDSALETVLTVQHALLPSRDRQMPLTVRLDHDYAGWHAAVLQAKDDGHRDWPAQVPPLRSFGAALFVVEDPREVCTRGIGYRIDESFHGDWELESPVSRALPGEHVVM